MTLCCNSSKVHASYTSVVVGAKFTFKTLRCSMGEIHASNKFIRSDES
jgi:hypothetical protein